EIDGQKVVFNSRYLEYVDVAATEYWEWTGIYAALGTLWADTEFHVRRAEIDYLRPFVLGDAIRIWARIDRVGTTSMMQRYEMVNEATGELHCAVDMVIVNVHLPTGKPAPIDDAVRQFIRNLPG
ncbi:MAG: acyl-CoA thioesterase, partial [Proteobacteria bacterium]|nr:acyl-CoA thioesterase [Pseudomonadota bacterium]